MNIGAVYDTYTPAATPAQPQKKVSAAVTDQVFLDFWRIIFSKNPNIAKRLNSQPVSVWLGILKNSKLTPIQKFEMIFGLKVSDLMPKEELLGDIFEWIGNLFSEKNLSKMEQGIRQGNKITDNIARAINLFRNSNLNDQVESEMNLTDTESRLISQASGFYEKYGPLMLLGFAGLAAYMIFKK